MELLELPSKFWPELHAFSNSPCGFRKCGRSHLSIPVWCWWHYLSSWSHASRPRRDHRYSWRRVRWGSWTSARGHSWTSDHVKLQKKNSWNSTWEPKSVIICERKLLFLNPFGLGAGGASSISHGVNLKLFSSFFACKRHCHYLTHQRLLKEQENKNVAMQRLCRHQKIAGAHDQDPCIVELAWGRETFHGRILFSKTKSNLMLDRIFLEGAK